MVQIRNIDTGIFYEKKQMLSYFECEVEGGELGVAGGPVGVNFGIGRIPSDGLRVVLHSLRPVTVLETARRSLLNFYENITKNSIK